MSLKPFREIPKDLAEWTRWFNAQTDETGSSSTSVDNTELDGVQLTAYEISHAVATVDGNTTECDYQTAQSWFIDLEPATGTVTITISGGPTDGNYGEMNIRVQQDTTSNRVIVWAGGTFLWAGGSAPTLTASADAVDIFHFQTINAGNTWTGSALQNVS